MKTTFTKTQRVVGIGAMAALLVGGLYFTVSPTMSSWTDNDVVHGVMVTNGNLDIEAVESSNQWFDISADVEETPKLIDASTFRLVPGDTLRYQSGFKVALEGDNLKAVMTVDNPLATGDTLRDPHGVTLSYSLYQADENGAPTGDAIATAPMVRSDDGTFKPQQTITFDLSPTSPGMYKKLTVDQKPNYVAVVELTFDVNTPQRELVQAQTDLKDFNVSLTQVREGALTAEPAEAPAPSIE